MIRIAGACGFWGDSSVAVPQLVRRAQVDYITFDYLAELTMSILAAARAKDPAAGWATDFVQTALAGMLPEIAERGIRLLTNAGGINPRGCAAALAKAAADAGVTLRIAIVEGDDVRAKVPAGLALLSIFWPPSRRATTGPWSSYRVPPERQRRGARLSRQRPTCAGPCPSRRARSWRAGCCSISVWPSSVPASPAGTTT